MKKNLTFLMMSLSLILRVTLQPVQAQQQESSKVAQQGSSKISGIVTDAETKAPVAFATIALLEDDTRKPVNGAMSDEKGRFTISKVTAGKYKLKVNFLGYTPTFSPVLTITGKDEVIDVGNITLTPDAKALREVKIVGERPLVEEKVDRTVYNADKDISNAGGTAADLLQKVPSLSVDPDGNVQLRGSANVQVLINNKPSAILAGNLSEALKQIPADMIKAVEVITSPSSRYDAEGTAGIINIITKKEGGQGINGSAAITGGTRANNGNGSLSVRRGNLGLNGRLGVNHFTSNSSLTNTTFVPTANSTSIQGGSMDFNGAFINSQLEFDYSLTPKSTILGSVRVSGANTLQKNDQEVSMVRDNKVLQDFNNAIRSKSLRLSTDYNLDFTRTFSKPQQELSILALYSVANADNTIRQRYANDGEEPYLLKRNTNEGSNKELTFQVDYVQPFDNKSLLEVGAKSILRKVRSDAFYRSTDLLSGAGADIVDEMRYGQDVYAAYLTYGFTAFQQLQVKLGGRYEYTDIQADIASQGAGFTSDYDNITPSLALAYTHKEKHTYKANFTQRIQRPSLYYLNPYRMEQTSNTVLQGNPDLKPELTNLLEIGYSTYLKTTSLSATLYSRFTDNAIEALANIDAQDVVTLTFRNIARKESYGISLTGSTKPMKSWTLGGSLNLYHMSLQSTYNSNSGWINNLNLYSSYIFAKGFSAQANWVRNSRNVQLLGSYAPFSFHSLAFKKEMFDKRGGLSLTFDNPFRANMRMRGDAEVTSTPISPIAYEKVVLISNYNRAVRVTLDYRFGKADKQKAIRKSKSIRNDDVKQGEGS
ncbi:TonB-dependent receptor domain-containing protein [Pontibacter cellulosilyticus]|uniref:TonB-dependent receptor n=1 Tax=Pontibacter cellulosilyticus TaxID=1720253 RepID=A0A923N665_9BACT|nr:TonB-dependent receptor [Pontibacter cellulosilyticus]MBC5992191.1 TonB-dependent receptor [Pontibacter cellulosilyticus]